MAELSIYQNFEQQTVRYYGADKDPLKFVPVISQPEVAREIAGIVLFQLGTITEAELAVTALRIEQQDRHLLHSPKKSPKDYREEALRQRLNYIVVNAEMMHASLAPDDFNEDSQNSVAFRMGAGMTMPMLPSDPPTETME